MKRIFFLFVLLVVINSACNKPREIIPDLSEEYSNGYPLKTGNYWIYRSTLYLKDGFIQVFPTTDSVWIEKDTVVNGKLYYLKKSTNRSPALVRDSLGYIMEKYFDDAMPVFSRFNFEDTLLRMYPYYRIMDDIGDIRTVPAGTFKTVTCKTLMRIDPNDPDGMHDFPMHDLNFHIHEEMIYANNVGMVSYITFFVGNRTEENLERYYIRK